MQVILDKLIIGESGWIYHKYPKEKIRGKI